MSALALGELANLV